MGHKKKRGHPDLEELLARPWCYYCGFWVLAWEEMDS